MRLIELMATPGGTFGDVVHVVRCIHGRTVLEQGDIDTGLVWADQVQGLIHDVLTCVDLIARIIDEAKNIAREPLTFAA